MQKAARLNYTSMHPMVNCWDKLRLLETEVADLAGKPVSLDVKPTEGMHDIYLVFKNPNAKPGSSLMVVMNTTFQNG